MRGHIYKRSKDSWTIVYDMGIDPRTFKRKQVSRSIKGTKKDAERELAQALHELATGNHVESARITTAEFLRIWIKDYVASIEVSKTRIGYESIVRNHLVPAFGRLQLANLRPRQISRIYAELRESGRKDGKPGGLSPRTISNIHRVLKLSLKYAVDQQILRSNPADSVKPPRFEKKRFQTLERGQIDGLLETAASSFAGPIIRMAVNTGLRQGEVLGLRWSDIDLGRGLLHVRQTLQYIPGEGLIVKAPKTQRSRRTVSFSQSVAVVLRKVRARQSEMRLLYGGAYRSTDLVFTTQDGGPISPRNLYRSFLKLLDKAGLPRIRFHDLRHTHATLLLAEGIPVNLVSERLGHTSAVTTLDIYAHVIPNMQAALAGRLDEILGTGENRQARGA